jgi:hypothetical protein
MPDTRNLGPKQRAVLLALERRDELLRWNGKEGGATRYAWTDGSHESVKVVRPLIERGLVVVGPMHWVDLTRAGLEWVAAYHREQLEWVAAYHRAQVEGLWSRVHELTEEVRQIRAELEARS